MKIFKTIIIFLSLVITFASSQWPFQKDKNWYIEGPKKDWSERDHLRYNRWKNKLEASRIADSHDDQLLRIQKAIINGNKITTEIWNYGSISSPGNRVTDIIWEGLGYGYEFGPFICAEVQVNSSKHNDSYIIHVHHAAYSIIIL